MIVMVRLMFYLVDPSRQMTTSLWSPLASPVSNTLTTCATRSPSIPTWRITRGSQQLLSMNTALS